MFFKDMKITNASGDSITFGRHFLLDEDIDLSGLAAIVNYAETTGDGAVYQRTSLDVRDFDIPFFIYRNRRDEWWIEERRVEAYTVFNPKKIL